MVVFKLLTVKSKMASKMDSYYIWILFQFQGQGQIGNIWWKWLIAQLSLVFYQLTKIGKYQK